MSILTDDSPREAADGAASGQPAGGHHPGKGPMTDAHGKPIGKKKDKTGPIIAVVSIVGVVIAWLTYKHGQSTSAAAAPATAYTSGAATGTNGNVAGDSTDSSDAQLGFQNLLSNMQNQLDTLESTVSPSGSSAIPTSPHFVYGSDAQGLNYTRDLSTGQVYQVNPDGSQYSLSDAQFAELGNPTATDYGSPTGALGALRTSYDNNLTALKALYAAPKPNAAAIKAQVTKTNTSQQAYLSARDVAPPAGVGGATTPAASS